MVGKGSSRFVFLLSMLLLILLIQILPQVDLPATAFRRNSEPLAIHVTLVSSPLVLISTSAMHAVLPDCWACCIHSQPPPASLQQIAGSRSTSCAVKRNRQVY